MAPCTRHTGCSRCDISNDGRDCQNNPIPIPAATHHSVITADIIAIIFKIMAKDDHMTQKTRVAYEAVLAELIAAALTAHIRGGSFTDIFDLHSFALGYPYSDNDMMAACRRAEIAMHGGNYTVRELNSHYISIRDRSRLSLDNGRHYMDVDELSEGEIAAYYASLFLAMDAETREAVHAENAPCSEREFLEAYLERAKDNLVIG